MFKDDRMISFLTAIVVMVAIGTVIQRASIFGGGDTEQVVVALVDDEIAVPANTLFKLDIFANDTGISEEEKKSLTILSEPKCGRLLAGRGVLQYFGGDACAGEQKIVYTLSAMDEPKAATVTAFVVSDARPDVRPEKSPAVAKAEPDSTVGDSPEKAALDPEDRPDDETDVAKDTAKKDSSLAELTVGGTPANASTRDAANLALDVEPEAARSLPGRTPDAPKVEDSATAGLALPATKDGRDTPSGIPDKPTTPNTPAPRNSVRISMALVPRGNTLKGPGSIDDAALTMPADANDKPLANGASPDANLAARRTPGDLGPETAAPRIGDVSTADRVPLPVKRSARIAAFGTATDADRDTLATTDRDDQTKSERDGVSADRQIAALQRADEKLGGIDVSDARAPLGTDVTPKALRPGGPKDTREAPRLSALSRPDVALTPANEASSPVTLTDALPAVPTAELSTKNRRPMGLSGAIKPKAGDIDAAPSISGAGSDVVTPRDIAPKTDRVAALTSDQKRTPRADQMHTSLEPDSVEADRKVAELALINPSAEAPKVAKGSGAGPATKRKLAVVHNDAASSYSFFTPVPRRNVRDGDKRIIGASRAAGAVAPELSDGAPGALQHGDERIAAITPAGRSGDLPNPGLALRRAPVEPGTEPKPERAPKEDTKPVADPNCTTPPSAELEIRRAARTIVRIAAPCQPESVAELNYSGLRLAIPLDRQGQGKVLALGFEANAAAIVKFTDGKEINFDLPFRGIGRIERIAVVWDIPVALELHALEFGAKTGDQNHVNPLHPRAFGDVRRAGGGFLHTYRAYAGYGQNAQIYTHWKRRGGEGGIVKLMIDASSMSTS